MATRNSALRQPVYIKHPFLILPTANNHHGGKEGDKQRECERKGDRGREGEKERETGRQLRH